MSDQNPEKPKPKSLSEFSESQSGQVSKPEPRKVADSASYEEHSEPDIRLFRGDWFDVADLIETNSVSLVAIDPPFGVTDADWDTEPSWYRLASFYDRIMKSNAQLLIFGVQPMLMRVHKEFQDSGFDYRCEFIRVKNNGFWTSETMPSRYHENVFLYSKKGIKADQLIFNHAEVGKRCTPKEKKSENTSSDLVGHFDSAAKSYRNYMHPQSIIYADVVGSFTKEYVGHPTQKPVKMMEWLIRLLTKEGDLVLDNFMGSGSTGVGARRAGRHFVGMEINHDFYKMAQDRITGAKLSTLARFDEEQEEPKEVIADADTEREDSDRGKNEGSTAEEKGQESKEEDEEVTFF
jgi:site-specific DNA-methyltransferase (adenine-specific)